MSELLVQIMAGPRAGQAVRMTAGGVTFGRSADNPILIPLPTVSRRHGEFQRNDEQWVLVNHSDHGTRVNRRTVRGKPRPVKIGDRIYIGDEEVLRVLDPAVAQQADAPAAGNDADAAPARPRLTGRGKLWAGIGIYLLLMLALFIFFSTLRGEDDPQGIDAPRLSRAEIIEHLRAPVTPQPDDPRRAGAALNDARRYHALIDRRPDAMYRSYAAYRQAMAFAGGDEALEIDDLRRYQQLEDDLVEALTSRYEQANRLLAAGRYAEAAEAFQQIARMYPEPGSALYVNTQRLRTAALQAARR